jgi:hypothetical protein
MMSTPIKITPSVALKLPGAMQLIQVPMIAGASYMATISLLPLDNHCEMCRTTVMVAKTKAKLNAPARAAKTKR